MLTVTLDWEISGIHEKDPKLFRSTRQVLWELADRNFLEHEHERARLEVRLGRKLSWREATIDPRPR
jgi:hypothetical protein